MALIKSVRGFSPSWGNDCFIAENATLVGAVQMGHHCTVWFNAVVRGDVSPITIGDYTNIQDGAVVHATYQRNETRIGSYVSIAHNAIVHGCTIEDYVLIGMGAIVMDGAVIKRGSIIGAGAVILQNTVVEPGSIWAGNPAKFIKKTDNLESEITRIANAYPMYAGWFQE
ncbi:MAG TPA: gamma carbonic anhydrase family protein [Microscillaceae bacterium]|jgi:carbonic anhydrase/acetyltransferase-like protein (isoleucine patch superfamily)|nr:gamma carbonic anhydrase family protein [Microscillaceae bacterium]